MIRNGYITLMLCALCFASCGKKDIIENEIRPDIAVIEAEMKYSWETLNMTSSNAMLCAGVQDGAIYFLREWEERFEVQFADYDGTMLKSIIIPRGKGPGEIMHSLGVKFYDDKVLFADMLMRRITLFSEEGEYLDEFQMKEGMDMPISFEIADGNLYYTGLVRDKITVMDIASGETVRKIPYEEGPYPMEAGEKTELVMIKYDKEDGRFYLAYAGYPYRIERLGKDLEVDMKIGKKMKKKYRPLKWAVPYGNSLTGDFMIVSMMTDDKYLYTARGFAISQNNELENTDFSIYVFEKSTGRFVYEIKNSMIEEVRGGISVIGITDEYIVLHMLDNGDTSRNIFGGDNPTVMSILVLKKPDELR